MVQLSWLRSISSLYSYLLVLVHLLKNELFPLTLPGLLLFEIDVHPVSHLRLLSVPPLCRFGISGQDQHLTYMV